MENTETQKLSESELNDLRQRALRGEIIPLETYKQVIASLRKRRAEDIASASAKKEKRVAKLNGTSDEEVDKILGDLL